MIIDCHCHLDERVLRTDELISKMAQAGIDRTCLIPFMTDPISGTNPRLSRMLQFLLTHRPLRGWGRRFTGNFTETGGIRILAKTYDIYRDPDNEPVFAAVEKHSGRFGGWIFVNPRGKKDMLKEIDRWISSPGCVGLKAHPFWHRYPPSELEPAAEVAVRIKKPLLMHLGFDEHGDFLGLADKFPSLKILLAHAAFPCYADTWRLIKERKNICVDLSSTAFVGAKLTVDVVGFLGVDRCLFGTDGPYGPRSADGSVDYAYLKRRIEKLFSDGDKRSMLLGGSFAKFTDR